MSKRIEPAATDPTASLDRLVGRVAGAIYGDIVNQFHQPPLMLVAPVTLKVRRAMEPIHNIEAMTVDQVATLAEEIKTAIIPLLFSLDIDPQIIANAAPVIETATMRAISEVITEANRQHESPHSKGEEK